MNHQNRTFLDKIFLILKGVAVGIANIIPGVSGGIIALLVGFYEELIFSIHRFNTKALKLLLNGRFKKLNQYINGSFLLYILTGITIGVFALAYLLEFLFEYYEKHVWSYFLGIILASVFYIYKKEKGWVSKNHLFILIGLIIGLGFNFVSPAQENANLLYIYLCGILSVLGMLLPGLSGSFIIIILGNYSLILVDALNTLPVVLYDIFKLDMSFRYSPEKMFYLKIFLIYILGSLSGFVIFSKILNYILKKNKKNTIAVLIGFIVGTLPLIWPWRKRDTNTDTLVNSSSSLQFPDIALIETWFLFGLIVLGALCVIILETLFRKKVKY